MTLIKTECQCPACNIPFITITPEEFSAPSYCPFCATPIDDLDEEE